MATKLSAFFLFICAFSLFHLTKAQTPWSTNGNAPTQNCFIGTTTPVPLVLKTNGLERLTLDQNGTLKVADLASPDTAILVAMPNGSIAKAIDPGTGGGDCNLLIWDGDGNAAGPNCFIGTTNLQPFRIHTNGIERMRLTADGNVVVHGVDAKAAFQIYDHMGITFNRQDLGVSDVFRSIGFNIYQDGNVEKHYQTGTAAKIEYQSNVGLLQLSVAPSQSVNSVANFPLGLQIDQTGNIGIANPTNPNHALSVGGNTIIMQSSHPGNYLRMGHNGTDAFLESGGSQTAQLHINMSNGRTVQFGGDIFVADHIGVGTNNFFEGAREYKLAINGHIRAKAAHIYPAWADYVFEEDYPLMNLEDLESYIDENGHLPGMPTAAEVAEQGIDIGEIQVKTLEKIEELTLYLLEMKQENDALKEEIEKLKAKLR